MGSAAYNRGSRLIRMLTDDEIKQRGIERANRPAHVYKYDWKKRSPFCTDGCIRIDSDGMYHFCHQQTKGWDSFSFWYKSMAALLSDWNIQPLKWERDPAGAYMTYRILTQWEDR